MSLEIQLLLHIVANILQKKITRLSNENIFTKKGNVFSQYISGTLNAIDRFYI